MEKKINRKKVLLAVRDYGIMTVAIAIVAAALYFFKYPNHFVLGGMTGLSVVVGKFTSGTVMEWLTPATFVTISNIILLIVGFIVLGKGFGAKTVYCSILLSAFLQLLELLEKAGLFSTKEPLTDQPFLELFFAVALSSFATAVIFNLGGSTGGSDIIGMIIMKKLNIDIGKAMLIADLLIVLTAFFTFDARTGLFSLFGVFVATLIINSSIESLNRTKYFIIITDKPDEISKIILSTIGRDATRWDAEGCYTKQGKSVLLSVMNVQQARRLRTIIKEADPSAFVLISNSSEIIGNGFRQSM